MNSDEKITVIGTISGSSLDGLDVAAATFEIGVDKHTEPIRKWKLLAGETFQFSSELTETLKKLPAASAWDLEYAHGMLGTWIGERIRNACAKWKIIPSLICSHGHTVFHHPEHRFTTQIGSGANIAAAAGTDTITDIRSADVAAGGQGAPFAPLVEKYLLRGYEFYLNLGGISNLSMHHQGIIRSWDVSPANQLLNFLAPHFQVAFDENGSIARAHRPDEHLLNQLLELTPMQVLKPYGMDNAFVVDNFLPVLAASKVGAGDQLSTCTHYIAQAIATHIHASLDQEPLPGRPRLLATGGGAHNSFLMELLRKHCPELDIVVPAAQVIDYKEALMVALAGVLRLHQIPNAIPEVTGAQIGTVGGALYLANP